MTAQHLIMQDIIKRLKADGQGTLSKGEARVVVEQHEFNLSEIHRLGSMPVLLAQSEAISAAKSVQMSALESAFRHEMQKIFDGYYQAALQTLHIPTENVEAMALRAKEIAEACIKYRLLGGKIP